MNVLQTYYTSHSIWEGIIYPFDEESGFDSCLEWDRGLWVVFVYRLCMELPLCQLLYTVCF